MWRVLSNQAHFLMKTNFFVSLGAVFLTLQTQVQLGMRPHIYPYVFIIFSASYMAYNTQIVAVWVYGSNHNGKSLIKEDQDVNRQRLLFILSIVLFFGAILFAKQKIVTALVPLSIITLCYSFPLRTTKTILFRLREVPLLKVFLISTTWSAVTVLLPTIHSGTEMNQTHVLMMLTERFLLIFAIAIPFDIRDMNTDAMAKLKTVPLIIGKGKALALSNVCLLAFIAISLFHFYLNGLTFVLPALILSVGFTVLLINTKTWNTSATYYAMLDGTLIFQGALVCLSYYVNLGVLRV